MLTTGPLSVVIQTEKSIKGERDGRLVLGYELCSPIYFAEPHFVRISHWEYAGTATTPCIILADFTQPQQIDGKPAGFLGLTTAICNDYIPLAGNYIPTYGEIVLVPIAGKALPRKPENLKGVLVLHIVPQSFLDGTTCQVKA